MATRKKPKLPKQAWSWERCEALVNALDDKLNPPVADVEENRDWSKDFPYVREVVERIGLTFADFVELDERPGRWGYERRSGGSWHYRLRRWRNEGPASSFIEWCNKASKAERDKRVKAEKARLRRQRAKPKPADPWNDWPGSLS